MKSVFPCYFLCYFFRPINKYYKDVLQDIKFIRYKENTLNAFPHSCCILLLNSSLKASAQSLSFYVVYNLQIILNAYSLTHNVFVTFFYESAIYCKEIP